MNHNDYIYHILPVPVWENVRTQKTYTPESLTKEGFIHFSCFEQLEGTAKLFFSSETRLVVIQVKRESVDPNLIFENTTGGSEQFPHLYQALPVSLIHLVYFWEKTTGFSVQNLTPAD